jgi:hypothetical protein
MSMKVGWVVGRGKIAPEKNPFEASVHDSVHSGWRNLRGRILGHQPVSQFFAIN